MKKSKKIFIIIILCIFVVYLFVQFGFNFLVSTEIIGNCCSCKGEMSKYDVCCDCTETLGFFEKIGHMLNFK